MNEDRLRGGLHRWLYGHFGTDGSGLYAALTASLAIALSGLAAYLFRQPLILLILGSTAVLFFKAPMARSSNGSRRCSCSSASGCSSATPSAG